MTNLALQHLSLQSGPHAALVELQSTVNELELHRCLENDLTVISETRFDQEPRLLMRREFQVGKVIPDFCFVAVQSAAAARLYPAKCTFHHCVILSALRQRSPLHFSSLKKATRFSAPRLEQLISELVKQGSVRRNVSGSFSLCDALVNLRTTVIGIEVKLTDWKRALEQAKSYMGFADFASVIMKDIDGDQMDVIRDSYRAENVGLYQVTEAGLVEVERSFASSMSKATPNREYVIASAINNQSRSWR